MEKILLFTILIIFLIYLKFYKRKIVFSKKKKIMTNNKYFNNFSDKDLEVRNCETKEYCMKHYGISIKDFSDEEKIIFNEIIDIFKNKIENKILIIFDKIGFVKVDNSIEGGLPHTRQKYIILSENIVDSIINKYKNNKNDIFIYNLIGHEQFHIFQRYNKELFNTLYREYWDLVKFNGEIPEEIFNLIRNNPDADKNDNWLFKISKKRFILPLCLYDNNAKFITNTINTYFNVEYKDGKLLFSDYKKDYKNKNKLNELKEYREYFGGEGANNYHPNELSSSTFENLIDNIFNGTVYEYEGYKKLIKFMSDFKLLN